MEPHKKHRTGTEHHHAELQDISWHNKGEVGTLSLQQLYNKKYKTTTNKGTNREQQRNGGLGAAPCSKIILQCFYKKTSQFVQHISYSQTCVYQPIRLIDLNQIQRKRIFPILAIKWFPVTWFRFQKLHTTM